MCFCVIGAPGRLNTGLAMQAESNLHFKKTRRHFSPPLSLLPHVSSSKIQNVQNDRSKRHLNTSTFHKISGVNFLCYAYICPLNHLVSIFLPSSPSPPPSLCNFLLSPWGEVEMGHTFPPGIPALMVHARTAPHKCAVQVEVLTPFL